MAPVEELSKESEFVLMYQWTDLLETFKQASKGAPSTPAGCRHKE